MIYIYIYIYTTIQHYIIYGRTTTSNMTSTGPIPGLLFQH